MSALKVTNHAAERATARFRIPPELTTQWLRNTYAKSRYICDIVGDNGESRRLFAGDGVALVLDPNEEKVITVFEPRLNGAIKSEMTALIQRKIAAANRKERAEERRIRIEKAKLSVELAQCTLRMELTPSKAVIKRNTEIIAGINASVAKLDAELADARRTKNGVVKSLAAYL
ncbi:hypothetical protein [Paenibacillus sp. YN15]|uniref:hypothetical protein n=1 Tax=Paenibacillus sp. YN15 TaxID=1742774 RepID=UPI000DCB1E12|nr:hypothetical protein [Paenibacillus sp. YN15]RAU96801.1 hypothetical protein DQG13_19790 [Paenibacillus sp. YN15]